MDNISFTVDRFIISNSEKLLVKHCFLNLPSAYLNKINSFNKSNTNNKYSASTYFIKIKPEDFKKVSAYYEQYSKFIYDVKHILNILFTLRNYRNDYEDDYTLRKLITPYLFFLKEYGEDRVMRDYKQFNSIDENYVNLLIEKVNELYIFYKSKILLI